MFIYKLLGQLRPPFYRERTILPGINLRFAETTAAQSFLVIGGKKE